jgi:hypothetical protein
VQVAEASSGAQQTAPEPAAGTKQDKDRQRKERQRQRKIEVASKSLQWAMEAMAEHGLRCVRSHVEAPSNLRPTHRSFVLALSVSWGPGVAAPARALSGLCMRRRLRRRSTHLAASRWQR